MRKRKINFACSLPLMCVCLILSMFVLGSCSATKEHLSNASLHLQEECRVGVKYICHDLKKEGQAFWQDIRSTGNFLEETPSFLLFQFDLEGLGVSTRQLFNGEQRGFHSFYLGVEEFLESGPGMGR